MPYFGLITQYTSTLVVTKLKMKNPDCTIRKKNNQFFETCETLMERFWELNWKQLVFFLLV